ncbi:MAG: SUMF1/EgtB/PvdO family nonheme iron enzyme [Myxococcaceae bacterium]
MRPPLLLAASFLIACGEPKAIDDAGSTTDSGEEIDAGTDAGADAGATDAGNDDAGTMDAGPADSGTPDAGPTCPDAANMIMIGSFCVDRFEGRVVRVLSDGGTEPHDSLYVLQADAGPYRAIVEQGKRPQGYISQLQAAAACAEAGKRLCASSEFSQACRGPDAGNTYPYGGTTHVAGYCNEGKGSSMPIFFGSNPANWTYADFNDPRLNQWDGGLYETGSFPNCVSPYGVYDCVGNLHEWGSDPADSNGHGRFRGGFYGDAEINGHGCAYVTSAHELAYHDYSTGFRCCADAH